MMVRLATIFGVVCLAFMGRGRFYQFIQGSGLLARAARSLVTNKDVRNVIANWQIATGQAPSRENWRNGRTKIIPAEAITFVRNEKSSVYFPLVSRLIRENDIRSIAEIGSDDCGDLIQFAHTFPDVAFTGSDFIAPKNAIPCNIRFHPGYPLDTLRTNKLKAEMLVAWASLCCCTADEIIEYVREIRRQQYRIIVISDPTHGSFKPLHDKCSRHIKGSLWGHNYVDLFPDMIPSSMTISRSHWTIVLNAR